jgi:hypothetical protein
LGNIGIDRKTILKMILKKQYVEVELHTGFIWLRIGISGGFL